MVTYNDFLEENKQTIEEEYKFKNKTTQVEINGDSFDVDLISSGTINFKTARSGLLCISISLTGKTLKKLYDNKAKVKRDLHGDLGKYDSELHEKVIKRFKDKDIKELGISLGMGYFAGLDDHYRKLKGLK